MKVTKYKLMHPDENENDLCDDLGCYDSKDRAKEMAERGNVVRVRAGLSPHIVRVVHVELGEVVE